MVTSYSSRNTEDTEKVDLLDQAGKIIGQATRKEVYQKGLLHPAVNIVIVNSKGEVFIQKRGLKKILPLYWDISASEHVKSGEDYKSAAMRGLKEELSMETPVKLLRHKHIQRNQYEIHDVWFIEYELVELYGAVYDGEIKFNPDEVAEGKFVSFEHLYKLIKSNQIKFSPWGLDELNYLFHNPNIIAELIS